jgi:hypothetical protein
MRPVSGERGAVAIIVAVLLVALVGSAALVVDVGALYQEKRELQNGADAGALAVARDCALGDCGDANTTADIYADDNAADDASNLEDLCGDGPGLAACADPPTVPEGAHYVQVRTQTEDSNGGDEVKFNFAPVLGSWVGGTVHAKAVAGWGAPSGLTGALPITFSLCEWQAYTDLHGFADAPPYDGGYPDASYEATIYFHDTTGANPCPAGPAGQDLAGGFGWLDVDEECRATTSIENWFDDKTGRPPPNECEVEYLASLVGTVVFIPIFDETNGLTGTNGEYHITGYAAFYLTGYSILGQYKEASLLSGQFPCGGQASCISGFFVQGLAPTAGGQIGGPDLGVTIIRLIG